MRLTVEDTGKGISKDYLKSSLYTPFSQEDPHSSGVGLGLCIMRQIVVDSMGGSIEIQSQVGSGTHVQVSVTLNNAPESSDMQDAKQRVLSTLQKSSAGLKVGLIGFRDAHGSAQDEEAKSQLESALRALCTGWFDMEVFPIKDNNKHDADIYIATKEASDELEKEINDNNSGNSESFWHKVERHPIIVICPDASIPPREAAKLGNSLKNRVVHFIAQP